MATKSRNSSGLVWSLIAIVVAVSSLLYCASFVLDQFATGWERLNLAADYFGRIIRGGNVS
ncbi:hypothetical protein DV702_14805 [Sporosarcina sp. PTS2304]|uniref:hypothetical protein n=1 Tax=Sporosarcina sp. PTS2304 TaxID=2283194 RepID=UPI000E0D9C0B|nr:hypothetical protein [Sporosarcina sp. PTS2304]AXI00864.1 hypothetical protein DV702_14805 [Sporosarcina sp. PTS2304]